jgi:hypothetical protein
MKLNIVTGKRQRAQRVCFYGVESVGKTTLAAKMPQPLFLDIEDGCHHLDVASQTIKSWTELLEVVKELASGSYGYKTVVLDSIDWAERLNHTNLCEQKKIKSLKDIPYGDGFVMAAERMARFLNDLDRLVDAGIHVVLIGHAQVKRQEPPDQVQAFDRYELKLTKQASPLVKEWVDHLLFLNFKTRIVESESGKAKGRGGKERVLFTTHAAAYDAKTRSELADELPLEWASIESLFVSSVPAKVPVPQLSPLDILKAKFKDKGDEITAFLRYRGKIGEDQQWTDAPLDYIAQVHATPSKFLDAVDVWKASCVEQA